jgi:hypothetical protein
MKRIIYLGVVVTALFLSSCQKDFLETSPTASVNATGFFSSLDNANVLLNGIHRYMYNGGDSQDECGEQSMMIRRDLLGEDLCMTSSGNGWFNTLYQWQDHRNVKSTSYPWKFYYRIIGDANALINGLETHLSDKSKEPVYQQLMAQSLTYRAWAHFNLVQLYAARYNATNAGKNTQDGVVLALTTSTKPQPRASVEAVYTQINADLDQAIAIFNTLSVQPAQISDLSLSAAQAIKARVALTMGNWQVAITNANSAMSAGNLFKATDIKPVKGFTSVFNIYPGIGSEWIWGHQEKSDQSNGFASFFAYMSWNFSSTNIRTNPKTITKELYEAMPATDARKALFSYDGYDIIAQRDLGTLDERASCASYESKKFTAAGQADGRGDLAYIRIAEMYLIAAEAQYQLGQIDEAKQTLYKLVSTRDSKYVLSTNTGSDLLNEILTQRRIELWGEGFRFTDLKRLDMPLNRNISLVTDPGLIPAVPATATTPAIPAHYNPGHISNKYAGHHNPALCNVSTIPAGDAQWQWVIPVEEMNANPNIKQNN